MPRAWVFAAPLLLVGCTSSADESAPPPVCISFDPACAPLYEPTYDQVFQRTLRPTCGMPGSSCHAETGRQGGLAFEDADRAFGLLAERGVVKAGDPACSKIMVRISSSDPYLRMPPGRSLDPAEKCAIGRWIANGAHR